jgi:DnaJ-class molecular chaperone
MSTPGYVWCAECHGLGTYDDSDDDMPGEEIECPVCGGDGEYPNDVEGDASAEPGVGEG